MTITQPEPMVASNGHGGRAPTEEMIRVRAYEVFETRGADSGDALSDWLTAEREIKAKLSDQ